MSTLKDAVLWVKNLFKINNVYDCARPFLLVFGLVGTAATRICKTEGGYALRNTSYSRLMTVFMSVVIPIFMIIATMLIFSQNPHFATLFRKIGLIVVFFVMFLTLFTVNLGYLMTYVSHKGLDKMFQILYNIDSQLEEVNIRVQHWKVTLKVTMVAFVTFNYRNFAHQLPGSGRTFILLFLLLLPVFFHLFFTRLVLFLLIIHERFVGLNKLLQQNATVTSIQIVGVRNLRDNYMLRRISLARHIHEQLSEVVQLFSDTYRYMTMSLLGMLIVQILLHSLFEFMYNDELFEVYPILLSFMQIVTLIYICQANKNEGRIRTARLRHLVAFETNRDIIRQVQQYIMYNAYSTTGLIDLQFTDVDNVLLFTIINVIASNMLIMYSYTR